jgi:hypothetical protein
MGNTQDAVTCGLGLFRRDSDLLPQQLIQQGGFAHIGRPYDGNKSGFEGSLLIHQAVTFWFLRTNPTFFRCNDAFSFVPSLTGWRVE